MRRFILYTLLGSGLLFVITYEAMYLTSQTTFCKQCHEMAPMYNAWANSSHKNVDCIDCHAQVGKWGYIKTKISATKELYYHIFQNYEKPIKATPGTVDCLHCHQDYIDRAQQGKDIEWRGLASHNPVHLDWLLLKCVVCHRGIVHDPGNNRDLPYDMCANCHSDPEFYIPKEKNVFHDIDSLQKKTRERREKFE